MNDASRPLPYGARVAHLIETDGPGGAERMLAQLAGELANAGCPTLAVLPGVGEGWLGRELEAAGVPVERVRFGRPFSPSLARSLAAILRRHKIDLVHAHEFTMAFYGAWAARRVGVPSVITMHGGRYYAGRLRRRIALRAAAGVSGGLVAVSRPLTSQLARDLWLPVSRVSTIPNGVRLTPARESTLRAELGLSPSHRLVVAVGNLYSVKGHAHLLDAVARLARDHPALHIAIAGRGDLDATLDAQATALGLRGRLHLLGLRADVANVLAAADVFVLPSLSEGLPLALLEAMLASRPIVASAVGSVPDVVTDGCTGLLVPPADSGALAAAIHHLLVNPREAQRLGEAAHARAAADFGVQRMVARYLDLYAQVLAPHLRLLPAPAVPTS